MKRFAAVLICALLLLSACTTRPETQAETPAPIAIEPEAPQTAAESPTEEPAPAFVPQVYNVYEEVGHSVSEAEMFRCDIDFDGQEEVISFRLDLDNDDTIILIDGQSIVFDESSQLIEVILFDLDPETPWINVLVEIDRASDDYVTTEVHLENGAVIRGVETEGVHVDGNGNLVVYERCEFLGTRSVASLCTGETMTLHRDWAECYHPTEEEIADEFDELVEWSDLLHATREVPCTINGKPAKLSKDCYIYLTRINLGENLAEVRTVDGVTATLSFTVGEDGWPYLIDGVPQDQIFDNILFAD